MERVRGPSTERKLTLEEYLALPDQDGYRTELVSGFRLPLADLFRR